MTIAECLKRGREVLPGGSDAAVLLAHVLGCETAMLSVRREERLTELTVQQYEALVARRAAGEPVAYLTGEREFMSLPFSVGPGILIPRPDTETLVEWAIARWRDKPCRLLDLCTGSGCIAVSLAHYLPQCTVTAVDVSDRCVDCARDNAARNGVADRVTVAEGDLTQPPQLTGPFDGILSNPPYIRPDVIATLAADVRDYEPRSALDGGPDGLRFYRHILTWAETLLVPGGVLAVEIGYDQAAAVCALVENDGRYLPPQVLRDLGGNDRVVWAERVS